MMISIDQIKNNFLGSCSWFTPLELVHKQILGSQHLTEKQQDHDDNENDDDDLTYMGKYLETQKLQW